MTDLVISLSVAAFLGILLWGINRHLILRQVEIDLKDYLGDLLVSRDSTKTRECACCRQNSIFAIKGLIRKHFKL